MQFALTEDQSYLSDQIQEFAKQQLASLPESSDPLVLQQRLALLAEQGLFGLCIPEALGGPEIDPITLCKCISVLGEVDASLATAVAVLNGFVIPALIQDSSSQHQEELTSLMMGESLYAWCELASSTTTWSEEAEGVIRVSGVATWAPLASIASQLLVVAEDPSGQKHIFRVSPESAGVRIQAHTRPLGLRSVGSAQVCLENVELSTQSFIGTSSVWPSEHATYVQQTGQTALAAVQVGIARAALNISRSYAQERKQFGKPIAAFQAIQWKIADMAIGLEAASLLTAHAASCWATSSTELWTEWSGSARAKASEISAFATQEAIQIHGGYGFTTEYPVERLYRDAHTLRSSWNPAALHQETIASSALHRA